MSYAVQLAERLALVATSDPATLAGGATIYSDVVDMKYYRRAVAIALMGSAVTTKMAATALTMTVYECTAAGTAASTALKTNVITRAQTTALTGQQQILDVRDTELGGVHASYTQYFKVGITAGTNAVVAGIVVLAGDGRYSRVQSDDLATVDVD